MRRRVWIPTSMLLVFASVGISAQPSHAYETGKRWPQQASEAQMLRTYDINDVLFALLYIAASEGNQGTAESAIRTAGDKWNYRTRKRFQYDGSVGNVRWWTAENLNDTSTFAIVDFSPSANTAYTKFNTNSAFTWHVNGVQGKRYSDRGEWNGWHADVYKVSIHEWGHWFGLGDDPAYTWPNPYLSSDPNYPENNSVMWFDPAGSKTGTYIDDKEAITMMYGLKTDFEVDKFLGLLDAAGNNPPLVSPKYVGRYQASCSPTGSPDYWTFNPGTDGVPAANNGTKGRYMRFQGCATSTQTSSVFMVLADASHDVNGCGSSCYMTIWSGMGIRWLQYNKEPNQCTFGIELQFSDGTYLSQYLSSAHPKNRLCGLVGQWTYQQINLPSSVVGKTITRWMIGYSNAVSQQPGPWRFYIDDLQIAVPGE